MSVFDDVASLHDIVNLDDGSRGETRITKSFKRNMPRKGGCEQCGHDDDDDDDDDDDSGDDSSVGNSSSSSSSCGIDCGGYRGGFLSQRSMGAGRCTPRQMERSLSFVTPSDCARRKVELLIDRCESTQVDGKRKLNLDNMQLSRCTFPMESICAPSFCQTLWCLSLSGNKLGSIPDDLVMKLTALRALDLSMCNLATLPKTWHVPFLKKLRLSHNCLSRFPSEGVVQGTPELKCLDLYGNEIVNLDLPRGIGKSVLLRLEFLDLGANKITALSADLAKISSLKTLKVRGNLINAVPDYICNLDTLEVLDVGCNPLLHPPVETCERGICSIRRYFRCLHREETKRSQVIPQDDIYERQRSASATAVLTRWKR